MSDHTSKTRQEAKEAFFEQLVTEAKVCDEGGVERLLASIRAALQNFRVLWFENGVWVRTEPFSIISKDETRWEEAIEFLRLRGINATPAHEEKMPKCIGTHYELEFLVLHVRINEERPPDRDLPTHPALRYSGW